jgi:anti-sigma factor RsiW
MDRSPTHETAVTDDLNAYLDGQLGPDEAAEVEARLSADPAELGRYSAYARHKQLLRDGADALMPRTVDLRTAALERELARKLERQVRFAPASQVRLWAMRTAAAVVLVTAGWVGHAQLGTSPAPWPEYVAESVGAHRVFAGDTIRPVELGVEAREEAVAWLSSKLGHDVDIPSLAPLGVEFIGARLQGTKEGPLAQFLYEDGAGHRLSLTIARHPDDAPMFDFAVRDMAGEQVGYWTDGGLDYAVVARTSDVQIRAIAAELGGSLTY